MTASLRWLGRAACGGTDPEQFFTGPQHSGRGLIAEAARLRMRETARRYCRVCPVIAECGAFADALLLQGLYGGSLRHAPVRGPANYTATPLIANAPKSRPRPRAGAA